MLNGDVEELIAWLEGWCDHEDVPTDAKCCAWGGAAARVRELAEKRSCSLCLGSGKDPDLEHLEDSLYGPVEVADYCRLCQGERIAGPDEVWRFVGELIQGTVA